MKLKKTKNSSQNFCSQDSCSQDSYFTAATSWSDDRFIFLELSRKRYQFAFFVMAGLVCILTITLATLIPLKKIQLAVIHDGPSGETWISTLDAGEIPKANWSKTKSEIAQYINLRESYDPVLYPYQSKQISAFSNDLVQDGYLSEQDKINSLAPLNFLSDKGFRTITVTSVIPLDLESKNTAAERGHLNLAQVNFISTDHYFSDPDSANNNINNFLKTSYTVLVSWGYTGIPNNPSDLLENWDGFEITKYQKQVVNMDK